MTSVNFKQALEIVNEAEFLLSTLAGLRQLQLGLVRYKNVFETLCDHKGWEFYSIEETNCNNRMNVHIENVCFSFRDTTNEVDPCFAIQVNDKKGTCFGYNMKTGVLDMHFN